MGKIKIFILLAFTCFVLSACGIYDPPNLDDARVQNGVAFPG